MTTQPPLTNLQTRDVAALLHPYTPLHRLNVNGPIVVERGKGVHVYDTQGRAYIEGLDPVSKRPFMQEVLEGLTKPLSPEDVQGATFERSTPRLLEPDTEENLHELFIRNRWPEMLPIVLPTQ